jgi:predicted nucleotidyltransferase component of viral defense system
MDSFLKLPAAERKLVFEETAKRYDVQNFVVIEKDFWVCWTLKEIFGHTQLAPHITFKGGTSLSKAYQIIDRFSEDIDLTISRTAPYLRDILDPMANDISGKERQRRIDALKITAQKFVAEVAKPTLEQHFTERLGSGNNWRLVLDNQDKDAQTLLFYYPTVLGDGQWDTSTWDNTEWGEDGYVRAAVKMEFGARGEIEPSEERRITPYAAEIFPQSFDSASCTVHVLLAERTFWEKATILHALYHGRKIRDRMSRHYYDTYILAQKGIADKAMPNVALLEQVVRNKNLMFSDSKASYDTAVIGSLRLMPKEEMLSELKRDYAAMEQMFLKQAPPDFEVVMQAIADLEKRINASVA